MTRAEEFAQIAPLIEEIQADRREYVAFEFGKYADGRLEYQVYTESGGHTASAEYEVFLEILKSMVSKSHE